MDTIEAVFQVPEWIEDGLEDGSYERAGGVIREVGSKSIVAWLREADPKHFSPGSIVNIASRIFRQGDVIGVLNLGISATGFALILDRIKHLETAVSEHNALLTQIDRKLDLSFYGNFVAAIHQANDAMMIRDPDTKRIGAMQAINRMLEAQHYFEAMLDANASHADVCADKLISTLFLAYTAEIRCHMELGETNLALSKIEKATEKMKLLTYSYVEGAYVTIDAEYLWCIKDPEERTNIAIRLKRLEASLQKQLHIHDMVIEAVNSRFYQEHQDHLKQLDIKLDFARKELTRVQNKKGFFARAEEATKHFQHGGAKAYINNARKNFDDEISRKQEYYAKSLPELLSRLENVNEDMSRFEAYQDELALLERMGITLKEWQQVYPQDQSEDQYATMLILTRLSPNK